MLYIRSVHTVRRISRGHDNQVFLLRDMDDYANLSRGIRES